MDKLENLEKLEKIEKQLKNEKLEKSEKEKLEKEKENLVSIINATLEKTSKVKGLYWIVFSKNNKTLYFNTTTLENLHAKGFNLPEKIEKQKYINYQKTPKSYNMLEIIFSIYSEDFAQREKIENQK